MAFMGKRPFYGWFIVGMAVTSGFLGAGLSQIVTGVMLKPITEDLGWTRTMTTGAITAGTITGGILSPLVGRLTDRYGGRFLMPLGALLSAGACVILAQLTTLWQFYAAYVLGRGVSAPFLTQVLPITAVANWFLRKRGMAIGIVAMSLPLGGSALTLLAQYIISHYGWRGVYWAFGALTLLFLVGPPILIVRKRPEDMGLLPDGEVAPGPEREDPLVREKKGGPTPEVDWSLEEALRTRSLWLIILGFSVALVANGAIGFHQVAYFTDVGIPAGAAAGALSVYALSGAFANAMWGFIADRIPARTCNIFALFMSSVMVGFLITVHSAPMAYLFAVLFGVVARGEASLVEIMIAQYYGRASYGSILGFTVPFQMIGLGFGPLIAAVAFDFTGSYQGVFMGFVATYLFAGLTIVLARPPRLPDRAFAPVTAEDKGQKEVLKG